MKFHPLWLRFSSRLALILGAMVLALLVLNISIYRYTHFQESKEYIKTFSQALSKQIQPALLTYNQSEMESLVEYLGLQQHILWLAIYNADGERIVSETLVDLPDDITNAHLPLRLSELNPTDHFERIELPPGYGSGSILVYTMPIRVTDSNVVWGNISLGYRLNSGLLNGSQLLQLLGILTLFGVGIGILIVTFFSRWITQPIRILHNATRSISTGNYDIKVEVAQPGEFAELARSFNLMSEEIYRAHAELSQQAELLELKVEQRTAELAASKIFNEHLVNSLPETIAIHQDGVIKFVNPAGVTLLGYDDIHEILNRPVLDFVHPRYHEIVRNRIKKMINDGVRVALTDEVFVKKDGSEITVETAAAPIIYNDRPAVVVTLRDISEIRLLQQQAARAERLETVGNIAAQVAHDLNNLLTPIVAYPDIILSFLEDNHKAIRYVDDIKRHGERIAEINQQLLTLSRRGHYNMEPVDLNNTILEVVEMITLPRDVVINLELSDRLLQISGGESQLARVFSNLILNSVDAMEGRGEILLKSFGKYVDQPIIGYDRIERGEYVVITLTDTGTGIPPEILPRIFDPFFTTKTASKIHGSGLGLSVVRNVVHDHQGYIDISTGSKGTTFTVYLPAIRAEDLIQFQEKGNFHGHEKILVIDDDLLQFKVLDELLSTLGYYVSYAETPEKGISLCKKNHYDLLVLDMVLDSELDGVDVFMSVREFKPNQKAIIISGYAESHRVNAGLKAGIGAFVRKPLTLEKIAAAIRLEIDRIDPVAET